MSETIRLRTFAVPALALAGATTAGAYMGFGSCGGYAWHDHAVYGVLGISMLAVAAGPGRVARRLGLAVAVVAAFLMAKSAGFAFYVGADSPAEYLRQMGGTFSSGFC